MFKDFSFMKTTTFESPLMVCTKQKVTETETEEENVIEEERGPEDLFVWSSAWSDTETETRHILASVHFNENENLQRKTQRVFDGKEYVWVTYPKFKIREEVV